MLHRMCVCVSTNIAAFNQICRPGTVSRKICRATQTQSCQDEGEETRELSLHTSLKIDTTIFKYLEWLNILLGPDLPCVPVLLAHSRLNNFEAAIPSPEQAQDQEQQMNL